jgi:hypothetical protein
LGLPQAVLVLLVNVVGVEVVLLVVMEVEVVLLSQMGVQVEVVRVGVVRLAHQALAAWARIVQV